MNITSDELLFILDNTFNKFGGNYWKECILRDGDMPGTQGYMIVYSDGSVHHTYHYPPDFLER